MIGVYGAQALARMLGAVVAFFGHKLWVFEHLDLRATVIAFQGTAYVLLWLLSLLLSLALLAGLTLAAGLQPMPAKLLTESALLVLNFSVLQHLVFDRATSAPLRPDALRPDAGPGAAVGRARTAARSRIAAYKGLP